MARLCFARKAFRMYVRLVYICVCVPIFPNFYDTVKSVACETSFSPTSTEVGGLFFVNSNAGQCEPTTWKKTANVTPVQSEMYSSTNTQPQTQASCSGYSRLMYTCATQQLWMCHIVAGIWTMSSRGGHGRGTRQETQTIGSKLPLNLSCAICLQGNHSVI